MQRKGVRLVAFIGIHRPEPAGGGVEVNPFSLCGTASANEGAGVERIASQQRQAKQCSQEQLNRGPHAAILDSVPGPRKVGIPVSIAIAFRTGTIRTPAFSEDPAGWRDDTFRERL